DLPAAARQRQGLQRRCEGGHHRRALLWRASRALRAAPQGGLQLLMDARWPVFLFAPAALSVPAAHATVYLSVEQAQQAFFAGARAMRAVERAFGAIERVHRAMSAQESTSDIARLRTGRRAALDPWTRRVLERAEELRLATDGLFDCSACAFALDGIAKGFAVD